MHLNPALILFTFALCVLAGVLVGVPAAFRMSRVDLSATLNADGAHLVVDGGRLPIRSLLVISEIGLTLMIVTGAGLLARSFSLLTAVQTGFRSDHLLTMTVPLQGDVYRAPEQQVKFAERILERVQAIPNVRSAAVSNSLPNASRLLVSADVHIEGKALPKSDSGVFLRAVSIDYFRAMGIRLTQGRLFGEVDRGRADAVVLSDMTARQYWPGETPIGRKILIGEGKLRTVIGVVADVKDSGPDLESVRDVYVPFSDAPTTLIGLVVQTSGDPVDAVRDVRGALRAVDKTQPVEAVATMREILDKSVARPRFNLVMSASFAF